MTLTKSHIAESVRNNTELSKAESSETLESLLEIMEVTLSSNEDILISGFGKFFVKEKKERKGRSPQTGEDMTLRNRRVVAFKLSGKLKDKLNITQ